MRQPPRRHAVRQSGTTAIEFALLATVFFTFMFGLLEVARAVFLWGTLQEVTRHAARAAALTDFTDAAAVSALRRAAIFRDSAGPLLLADPVDDSYVRIDYLSQDAGGATALVDPGGSCPRQNLINCAADPHGAACIALVRARLCLPTSAPGACDPVPYAPMVGLLTPWFASAGAPIHLPTAPTVAVAESFGYRPGAPGCP